MRSCTPISGEDRIDQSRTVPVKVTGDDSRIMILRGGPWADGRTYQSVFRGPVRRDLVCGVAGMERDRAPTKKIKATKKVD